MKKIILLISLFCAFAAFAQRTESYVAYADEFFDAALYVKAIPGYKAALEKNPNYVKAKYRLAECYRFTLNYDDAQFYYGDIAKNSDSRYPLAGYYYALMQKLKGQYSNALTTFKIFQRFLRDQGLNDDEKYRSFYQQAKVEIDGCQLALNQISMKQPDHSFAAIAGDLNSEYNDYAAFPASSDDLLYITTGRKGGKGGLQNDTFGETFEDIMRFRRDAAGEWVEYDLKDKFESTINTKWGEGSGTLNAEKTKFYYTNCNDDLGSVCQIFVSYLQEGKWSEPVALNSSINQRGYTSRQPYITQGGDSLFFVSDREGTLGGFDIWMSITAGGDNWSPPVNLGKQINTPFNESSPFYSSKEKVLFFASEGHRGFGGYDIYIAKGKSLDAAEIYNAGMPFNSSRDDVFFYLGKEKGFVSSNREGGPGKLDIFEFNIQGKEEIISEVSTAETIAGRNSLFTDDYNFDNTETDIINQIISRRISSSFSQVDVYLSTEQLAVYNSLSQDDKDRIDRIVNGRIRKMTSTSLRSIRSEDEYYYQQLDADKRKKVDNVVTTYLEEQGLGLSISLSSESSDFYNSENPNDREKLDILISERLRTSSKYQPKSINYEKLSAKDKTSVDGIALKYLSQKKSITGIKLTVAERVFMRDVAGEKAVTVNAAIKEKLLELSREEKYKLLTEDNQFYEELTPVQRKSLKDIATAFLIADLNSFDQQADQAEITAFNRMGSTNSQKVDKLILKLISNLASSDAYRAETFFETGELLAANSGSADETLERLFSLDRGMTENDKEAIERFVRSTYKAYLEEAPVFIKPVSADGDGFVVQERVPFYSSSAATKSLVESIESEIPFVLPDETLSAYNALPANKRALIDRLIGLAYIRKSYEEGGDLESKDPAEYRGLTTKEKTHVEVLAKNFRGEALKPNEKMLLNEAFTFYSNLAQNRKATINRLVLSKAFVKRNSRYVLDFVDVAPSQRLTPEERKIRGDIQRFRFQNERVITENQSVEANDYEEPPVDTIELGRPVVKETTTTPEPNQVFIELPAYSYSSFDQMTMKGTLLNRVGNPVPGKAVTLLKQDDSETSITGYTDNEGKFEFKVNAFAYKMVTEVRNQSATFSVSNFDVKGVDKATLFEISSVAYFDTNSEDLRSEAKKLLDEVIAEYQRNPVRIEVESHTDDIGNAEYNRQLSRRRGNTAFEYLVAAGVKKSDLSVVWHGFEKPIASNDNPYGRQLNRRMDIRMLGTNKFSFNSGQYFLVKPKATLASIARSLGVSVSSIVETNGLSSQEVNAYQPIRIKSNKKLNPDSGLLVSPDSPEANSSEDDASVYVVKAGDTLESIARKFRVPEELLMELNSLRSPRVTVGMELKIK
ncbi:MAG: LysM peptidoglycan-binding domain-containing protein [Cyclobacteriaceae bacterium]